MKKYVEVFWAPLGKEEAAFDILFAPPKPIISILNLDRKNAEYLKCPAFQNRLKNEFVIPAPFDLNVSVDLKACNVSTDRFGQTFYDKFVISRRTDAESKNPYLLTIPPYYIFYSRDDVEIESKDLTLLTSKSSSNFKVVPGAFNISKWVRPIELACEVVDAEKPIEIRMGEPLFSIKFTTPKNAPIKLTRVEYSEELHSMSQACTKIKLYMPGVKLPRLYEMASEYLALMMKK